MRGIGPATAKRIVEQYGEDTFDVIEHHPEMLADVQGISRKKADEISEVFRAQFGIRGVMMFCRDFVGPAAAVKIYKKWGGSAVDTIRGNPYILCDEVPGIGFIKADRIARSIGGVADAPERLRAGIKFLLRHNADNNGHVYLPEDKLTGAAAQQLGADRDKILTALESLITEGQLVRTVLSGRSCIYGRQFYDAEHYIADRLTAIDRMCEVLDISDIDRHINQLEIEFDIEYAAMQRKAISAAMSHGVMVLTGGPGTGKTTVIRAALAVFDRIGYEIALAAPTGRAAKRMSEATSREAKTVHRLLEIDFSNEDTPAFKRNEKDAAGRRYNHHRRGVDDGLPAYGGALQSDQAGRAADSDRRRRPAAVGGRGQRALRHHRERTVRHCGA